MNGKQKEAATTEAGIAYFYKGIEAFCNAIGFDTVEFTERLANTFRITRQWDSDKVSRLRRDTSEQSQVERAKVEVASGTRSKSRKPHPSKGKKLAWWSKLTEAEKKAVIAKRIKAFKAKQKAGK